MANSTLKNKFLFIIISILSLLSVQNFYLINNEFISLIKKFYSTILIQFLSKSLVNNINELFIVDLIIILTVWFLFYYCVWYLLRQVALHKRTLIVVWGLIFSIIFWFIEHSMFMIGIIYLVMLDLCNKCIKSYIKYFIVPIIFVAATSIYKESCTGFFCIFEGNGLPFPFYNEKYDINFINWNAVMIDYVFWFIVYFIVDIIYNFAKKRTISVQDLILSFYN